MNKFLKSFIFLFFLATSSAHAYCGYLFDFINYKYIAARGGLAWHQKIEITANSGRSTINNYSIGPTGSISMGVGIDAFRFEAEGLIIYNELESTDITLPPPTGPISIRDESVKGHIRHLAIMFNGFFDLCLAKCATLYLGAGVGVDFYNRTRVSPMLETSATKNENLFAFQFMPGLAYHLTNCLDLTLGYRLYMTQRQKSEDGTVKTKQIPIVHNLEFGLRYKL